MFGMSKKDEKKEIINDSKPTSPMFGRDFVKQSEASANAMANKSEAPKTNMPPAPQSTPPVTTSPTENTSNTPQQFNPNMQTVAPKVDPVSNLTLPSLPKTQGAPIMPQTNNPETKTNNSSYKKPIQKINPRPFTSAKGPVFVSVKRYKELMTALNDLKYNASHLRQIIADLKQNRDTGTGQLSETADALSSLEDNISKVNSSIKA